MKRSILYLLPILLSVYQFTQATEEKLSHDETKQWLENYKNGTEGYGTEKMKEWCKKSVPSRKSKLLDKKCIADCKKDGIEYTPGLTLQLVQLDDGSTLLHLIVMKNDIELAKYLLETFEGVNFDLVEDKDKLTAVEILKNQESTEGQLNEGQLKMCELLAESDPLLNESFCEIPGYEKVKARIHWQDPIKKQTEQKKSVQNKGQQAQQSFLQKHGRKLFGVLVVAVIIRQALKYAQTKDQVKSDSSQVRVV